MNYFQNQNQAHRNSIKTYKKSKKKYSDRNLVAVTITSIEIGSCTLMFFIIIFFPSSILADTNQVFLSDYEITQRLIQKSISEYPNSCPCPQSYDRVGKRCGNRSAYSRPGGHKPLCLPKDVTPNMIDKYRRIHGLQ